MRNVKKVFIIFFFYFVINYCIAEEINIKLKIEDEIITSQDIQDEAKFLALINTNLRNIPKEDLFLLRLRINSRAMFFPTFFYVFRNKIFKMI